MEEGGRKGGKAKGKGAGNCPQALPSRADDSRTQAGHLVGRDPKQIDAGVEVWDGMQDGGTKFVPPSSHPAGASRCGTGCRVGHPNSYLN